MSDKGSFTYKPIEPPWQIWIVAETGELVFRINGEEPEEYRLSGEEVIAALRRIAQEAEKGGDNE